MQDHQTRPIVCAALTILSLVFVGCSGTTDPLSTTLAPGQAAPSAAPGGLAPYALTEEEKALDCKKLTGRVQVRILQVRDFETRATPSSISHALQSAAVLVGSPATRGLDPAGDNARDRIQLEAYNQRLAAMNCKTFNLDEELKPKSVKSTPTPVATPPVAKPPVAKPNDAAPAAAPPAKPN